MLYFQVVHNWILLSSKWSKKGLAKTLQTHRGWWPMNDLEAFSCNIHLRVGHQSIGKAVSILFVVLDTRNGSIRNKLQLAIALHMSALCLPNVTSHDLNFQAYPFHVCIQQAIKGSGMRLTVICGAWIMAVAPQDSLCLSPCNFYCQMWFLQCWKSEVGFNGKIQILWGPT